MMRAAGQMGWSEEQFDLATPAYLAAAFAGFCQRDLSHQQSAWERARYMAFHAVAPHAKKDRLRKLTDLGRFPWEKAEAPPPKLKAPEQMADFIALAKQMHADHGLPQATQTK